MKKFLSSLAILITLAAFVPAADASESCQQIYGGGETCTNPQISINKLVKRPDNSDFVDNLGINEAKYKANQNVAFRITVTNIGNKDLTNVQVKDVLPDFVTFVSGNGDFNTDDKTLSFTIDSLKTGKSKSFDVVVKVVSNDTLPNDQGIVCVTNHTEATAEDQNVDDNAQFCIEKPTLGIATVPTTTKGGLPILPPQAVKTTPSTGPEAIALISLIPGALAGIALHRVPYGTRLRKRSK